MDDTNNPTEQTTQDNQTLPNPSTPNGQVPPIQNNLNYHDNPNNFNNPNNQNAPNVQMNPNATDNSHIANNPKSSNAQNKTFFLIICALLLLALIIIIIVVFININKSQNTSDAAVPESNKTTSPEVAFENLTKEQALAFLRSQSDITGIIPENYVGKEITGTFFSEGNTLINDLDLVYSYDTLDDLNKLARDEYEAMSSHSTDDYDIKEYDYYAIITPARAEDSESCRQRACKSLLSFKRSYLDYKQEETTPNSYQDTYYLATKEPEIINYLMRVYSFFAPGEIGGHGNIYDYDFEEQDDKYILTIKIVGAGINADLLRNPSNYTNDSEMYGINLYLKRIVADKADGRIYVLRTSTGTTEDVKTLPITEEEYNSLPGYGAGFSFPTNTSSTNTSTNDSSKKSDKLIEFIAQNICENLNGSFSINGYQSYLYATNYYSCNVDNKNALNVYVFNNSFTESIFGRTTLASAQQAGVGNRTNSMIVLDVDTDHYKGYESYTYGYLVLAGFNNLQIELRVKTLEQADEILRTFGYPE